MYRWSAALVLFGFLFSNCDAFERSRPVETKSGTVRGHLIKKIPGAHDDVYTFSAIPFAEPPIGQLRYRKTVPKQRWNGELDATNLPNECLQADPGDDELVFKLPTNTSEDCLYLNIWTPKTALDSKQSLPVFFWIHGGAFYEGSTTATKFNGTIMSSFHNIVYVSIQYRLGPLGFAYLGVPEVPGNMAIWDQVEALKWTYENIAAFGGDPSKITIVGQSAGAASVTLLLLSPHSQPYIHQAIVQSASAAARWTSQTPQRAENKTNKLLGLLAKKFPRICGRVSASSSVDEKVACLMNSDPQFAVDVQLLLLDIDRELVSGGVADAIPLPPVIDGDFLPDDPAKMLAEGNFKKVPLLIGINRDEGSFFMLPAGIGVKLLPTSDNPDRSFANFTYETYRDFVESYYVFYPENGQKTEDVILQQIALNYWPRPSGNKRFHQPPPSGQEVVDSVKRMVSDSLIACPVITWAVAYSQHRNVYQYMFNHQTESKPEFKAWRGVEHSDEMQYTMGDAVNDYFPRVAYTADEKALSRRIMQYWASFVKNGDPNVVDESIGETHLPKWPKYDGKTGDTFELNTLNSESAKLINSLKQRDCLFWTRYLPKLNARLKGELTPGVTPAPCPQYQYRNSASSFGNSFGLLASVITVAIVFVRL